MQLAGKCHTSKAAAALCEGSHTDPLEAVQLDQESTKALGRTALLSLAFIITPMKLQLMSSLGRQPLSRTTAALGVVYVLMQAILLFASHQSMF